jgi:hypothetical protein
MSVITLALLFWFISAPDPRFGFGFMFAAAFLMLAYGLYSINLVRLESSNTWIVITVLMVGLSRMASAEHNLEWPKMIPSTLRLAFTPASDRIWAPVPPDDRCYALVPCSPEPENIRYYPERAIQRAPTR